MGCKPSVLLAAFLLGLVAFVAACGPSSSPVEGESGPTRSEKVVVPSPNPSLGEMVGISPIIFQGSVVGMRYGRHEGSKQPYTFVRFSGIQFLRKDGTPPLDKAGTLEISYLGGLMEDGRRLEVSISPRFEIGKRYVVFLRGGGWRLSPIPGGNRGAFRLIGRKEGDPVLANLNGMPIGEFVNGYPIAATPGLAPGETDRTQNGFRVEDIPPGDASEAEIAPRRSLGADQAEKREAAERDKDQESIGRPDREDPDGNEYIAGLQGRWSRVVRLSELNGTIAQLVEKTKGKYPEFAKVYALPVVDAQPQNQPPPSEKD